VPRALVPLVAIAVSLVSAAAAPARQVPQIRDVGPLVGLRQHESSYAVAAGDVNVDGWEDLLIVHHGSRPSELFVNQPDGGTTRGYEVALRLVDTIHARSDRHGCILGDPNDDAMTDIFCVKGANQGASDKWNELWLQGPEGAWVDEAATWGVEDLWGRGRHPAWIDLNGDDRLDLFVGNDYPRQDDRGTPNRTYVNDDGERFVEVDLGLTREDGADCVQVLDIDGDGRDDLLLCGKEELFVYLRRDGGFVRANERYGLTPEPRANGAHIEDLSGDGVLDIVIVHPKEVVVRLGGADGRFGEPVWRREIALGHGLAVGDVDGRDGPDVYAVMGCVDRENVPDLLLLNGGDGRTWTQADLPPLPDGELAGCGDTAEMTDFDRDGLADIVVLNGGGNAQPLDLDGPDQLLTMGDWQLPG
jgi:hypothetical protein